MQNQKREKPQDFLGFMLQKANNPDPKLDRRPLGNVQPDQIEQLTNQLKKNFGKRL